ncbi:MAG: hypothetical protein AAFO82_07165 [Bacteroidota bacterium]
MEQQPTFRLDRTKFQMQTFEEADFNLHEEPKNYIECLRDAHYLISVAYNFDINHPPRLDRTIFSMRKHQE